MKGVIGFLTFFMGIGLFIGDAIKTNDNISWWFIMVIIFLISFGLDLVITDKIDTAKEEMRREIEETR
jgi:ABC-type multidrug transport system permease subunit